MTGCGLIITTTYEFQVAIILPHSAPYPQLFAVVCKGSGENATGSPVPDAMGGSENFTVRRGQYISDVEHVTTLRISRVRILTSMIISMRN